MENLHVASLMLARAPTYAVTGQCGLVAGTLFVPALRGGLGAAVGLYLATALSFARLAPIALRQEFGLGLLAIIATMIVLAILSARSIRPMVRAALAALPGLGVFYLFQSETSSDGQLWSLQVSLLFVLLALPLAGIVHSRVSSATLTTASVPGQRLSLNEGMWLARTGAMGAGFVFLVVGLTTFVGSLLSTPVEKLLALGLELSLVEQLLTQLGPIAIQTPVHGLWVAILTGYAALRGVGYLAHRGFWHGLYLFLRFVALILICCLVAFAMEQALEIVLLRWRVARRVGQYLLLMGYGLPVGAVCLALVFALVYAGDRVPIILTGLGFGLWFIQVTILSSVLSFVCGVGGLWIGILLGPFLDRQGIDRLWLMPWNDALSLGGAYLGFFTGLLIMLFFWLKGDLGILVSRYRSACRELCHRVDRWLERLVLFQQPWWALAGFGAASLVAVWLYIGVLSPVLVRRF